MADNPLALAPQTALGLGPLGLIRAAVSLDLKFVSIRLKPGMADDPTPDLVSDLALRAQVRDALADCEPALLDVEVVRLTPQFDLDELSRLLDAGRILGASRIVASGNDPEQARLEHNLAMAAGLAAERGISISLEHAPYLTIRTVADVVGLVDRLSLANVTLLSDPLHLHRSGGGAASLAGVDPVLIAYADFCDAPANPPDDLRFEARSNRRDPGQGGLPLSDFVAALPSGTPLRLEVPRDSDATPIDRRLRELVDRTRQFLMSLR